MTVNTSGPVTISVLTWAFPKSVQEKEEQIYMKVMDKHFKAKHLSASVLKFPGLPEEVALTKYFFHETLI